MPKTPVVTSKRLIKMLRSLGFREDHVAGSHFIFHHPQTKKRAVVPRHLKDLPKGTLMSILREAGISKEEFGSLL
ncbi:MAG: type II toxin-antitoxin system HicA family toxin [Candidatus Nealsonbacteria bacterium]